jgi:hypothetical protein
MKTQWFPTSNEVQDTEVIKQGVGDCLLGKRWNFVVDYLEKGATITAEYYVPLLDKLKQQQVFRLRGKLSNESCF